MKNEVLAIGLILANGLAVIGCGNNNDRIREQASIQSEEGAKKQVDADNANLEKRVKEAEADLLRRQRFIRALEGEFNGEFSTSVGETFNFLLSIQPSPTAYIPENRVRTLEEINEDIKNMVMNLSIAIVDPQYGTLGRCEIQDVRPDIERALFRISECKMSLTFDVSQKASDERVNEEPNKSVFPAEILNGTVLQVDRLQSQGRIGLWSELLQFSLLRIKEKNL